jgi:hypothetical protein
VQVAQAQSLKRVNTAAFPRGLQKELADDTAPSSARSWASASASLSSQSNYRTSVAPAPTPPRMPLSDMQTGALYGAAISLVVGALLYWCAAAPPLPPSIPLAVHRHRRSRASLGLRCAARERERGAG